MLNSQMPSTGGGGGLGATGNGNKIYSTKVDLRTLANELSIIFYVSGNSRFGRTLNKEMWLKLDVDLDTMVEMVSVGEGDEKRVFLNFNREGITQETYIDYIGLFYGGLNIELFKKRNRCLWV